MGFKGFWIIIANNYLHFEAFTTKHFLSLIYLISFLI